MARTRRRRRRTPVKAYALLFLCIIMVIGGIFAIGTGIYQLLQPKEDELPDVIGTQPEVVTTFQPTDDLVIVELEEEPLPVVVIDPGHGGTDGGTVGLIVENVMTTAVSSILYDLLVEDGRFDVVLTRALAEEDQVYVGLNTRVAIATEAGADLFLSIHGNAYAGTEEVRGTECFAIPPGQDYHEESLAFAQLIAAGFAEQGATLRGESGVRYAFFDDNDAMYYGEESDLTERTDATYLVLEDATYPAVLVEQCYLSSEADMEIFGGDEGYAMAAQVYYESICTYFYPDGE